MNGKRMNEDTGKMEITTEWINSFIEEQLCIWELAKKNYSDLASVKRRKILVGELEIFIQCNPARIISTGANITDGKAPQRPCFLCERNRPAEQNKSEILPGWDLLVNPYPILPVHFTIVNRKHLPQAAVPDDIVAIAERLPGMVVFFNGARAGASAPDHLHLQAVLKNELPLINLAEKIHPSNEPGIKSSSDFGLNLPYLFFSGVIPPSPAGYPLLMAGLKIGGPNTDGKFIDSELVNSFFWKDDHGVMRFISIPRIGHRPSCYFAEGDERYLISPGCIDMAGIIITPREEDFNKLNQSDLLKIYSEVAVTS